MRVLITGITGFVGSHLAEFLLSRKGIDVYGIVRWRSKTENIEHIKSRLRLCECDLRDASSVRKVIDEVRPQRIFHLAAQSFVPMSWSAPAETLTTNIIGQLNIFEAVRNLRIKPLIHVAGSSEEYGMVKKDEIPVNEDNALRPLSPYGISKVGQDLLGYQYFMSYKMKIVITRAFNHSGPRRGEVFVESNFANQIAKIEKGLQKPIIYAGNLNAIRDFTDVRDIVKAYHISLEKCKIGEVYNVCSGRGYSIAQILNILLSFSNIKPKIKIDPQRLRASDVPILIGNNSKFRKETLWKPTIRISDTLKDLLNYWRGKV